MKIKNNPSAYVLVDIVLVGFLQGSVICGVSCFSSECQVPRNRSQRLRKKVTNLVDWCLFVADVDQF